MQNPLSRSSRRLCGACFTSLSVIVFAGFSSPDIAAAGKPLDLTFVSKGESCANTVNFPSLKKTLTVKSGERASITFTPEKSLTARTGGIGM